MWFWHWVKSAIEAMLNIFGQSLRKFWNRRINPTVSFFWHCNLLTSLKSYRNTLKFFGWISWIIKLKSSKISKNIKGSSETHEKIAFSSQFARLPTLSLNMICWTLGKISNLNLMDQQLPFPLISWWKVFLSYFYIVMEMSEYFR